MAIGMKENVEKFTPQQMREWYSQKILTSRRVLAIYGDIDVDQAKTPGGQILGRRAGRHRRSRLRPGPL